MNAEIILAAVTGAALTALVTVVLCRCKPKKKKKNAQIHMEFSKRIFIMLSGLVGAVTCFVCVMVWRTDEISVIQSLIDNAFDLLKVGVVSYFSKAALENRIKLTSIYPKLKNYIMNDRSGES
jgi:uncharacterized membrane protein